MAFTNDKLIPSLKRGGLGLIVVLLHLMLVKVFSFNMVIFPVQMLSPRAFNYVGIQFSDDRVV